ncbi:SulP family inorganic anion transporter [Anaerobiospirillum thomasii]|nr:SulP family inorganic anion transporter [Anaerobiospirillum thomasii]
MSTPKSSNPFVPAFFTCMREGYNLSLFKSDFIAGLTVAIVALPLAMAMAVASGASPDKGLVTAVVAGFFISFLGGSRVQIGGPTGAFVVVIFDVIARYGFDGLIVSSIMAGLILIVAGYAKLGKLIKYIPYPVITGFTTGIAVIIASSQVMDFLGLNIKDAPADFIGKWTAYFEHIHQISPYALGVGLFGLALIIICKKISNKIPSYLVVIVTLSLMVYVFKLPVDTIGSRFEHLPEGLPEPIWPEITLEEIRDLIPSAFTIAFLAGIEALLSAVVADSMIGHKHSLNQELIGQGVANMASGIFGGLPATGAIARTATNIKSGGKTPVSGIFHALFLLIFMYTIMDVLSYVPMPALAAILFMVSWGMSDLKHFIQIAKISPSDRTILILTFLLTVLVDLTVAIGVGVTFASLLFMRHMSKSLEIKQNTALSEYDSQDGDYMQDIVIPEGLQVMQINGPLFFGVASELCDKLQSLEKMPRVLILRMRFMPYLDASGEASIEDIIKICKENNTFIIFSAMRRQPRTLLAKAGILERDEAAFTVDFKHALKMAMEILSRDTK